MIIHGEYNVRWAAAVHAWIMNLQGMKLRVETRYHQDVLSPITYVVIEDE